MIPDNPKGISKLRFWGKNRRINGISELPAFMQQRPFDVVLAGCFVPLALGVYWRRSNTPGAIAAILSGTLTRLALYYLIPERYAGLDTLIAPVVSLVVFALVSLATQKASAPKHDALTYVPTDEELVKGIY